MVLKSADRVLETTTTTGVSSFSLGGALTGYQTFNAGVGNGNKCYYAAVHSDLGSYAQWEVGIGTLSGGATLTRQAISSSNSNNLVSFSTGTKYIFVTTPAIRGAVYDDDVKALYRSVRGLCYIWCSRILTRQRGCLRFGRQSRKRPFSNCWFGTYRHHG